MAFSFKKLTINQEIEDLKLIIQNTCSFLIHRLLQRCICYLRKPNLPGKTAMCFGLKSQLQQKVSLNLSLYQVVSLVPYSLK